MKLRLFFPIALGLALLGAAGIAAGTTGTDIQLTGFERLIDTVLIWVPRIAMGLLLIAAFWCYFTGRRRELFFSLIGMVAFWLYTWL